MTDDDSHEDADADDATAATDATAADATATDDVTVDTGSVQRSDSGGKQGSEATGERGGVLTPEDLDIASEESVAQLDEDRYVVSADGSPPNVTPSKADRPRGRSGPAPDDQETATPGGRGRSGRPSPGGPGDAGQRGAPASPEAARSLLASELARANADYGVDVVGRFGGETVRHRTASNDVVGTFENLVRWYARSVTDDTPVDEAVAILLREANLASTGEADRSLAGLLDAHGLEGDDSIDELVDAIREESSRHG